MGEFHLTWVWPWIVAALQAFTDAAGLITWQVSMDSTINRAHQHAAEARRIPSPGRSTHENSENRGSPPTRSLMLRGFRLESTASIRTLKAADRTAPLLWTDDLNGADAKAWLTLAAEVLGVDEAASVPGGSSAASVRRVTKKKPPVRRR